MIELAFPIATQRTAAHTFWPEMHAVRWLATAAIATRDSGTFLRNVIWHFSKERGGVITFAFEIIISQTNTGLKRTPEKFLCSLYLLSKPIKYADIPVSQPDESNADCARRVYYSHECIELIFNLSLFNNHSLRRRGQICKIINEMGPPLKTMLKETSQKKICYILLSPVQLRVLLLLSLLLLFYIIIIIIILVSETVTWTAHMWAWMYTCKNQFSKGLHCGSGQ